MTTETQIMMAKHPLYRAVLAQIDPEDHPRRAPAIGGPEPVLPNAQLVRVALFLAERTTERENQVLCEIRQMSVTAKPSPLVERCARQVAPASHALVRLAARALVAARGPRCELVAIVQQAVREAIRRAQRQRPASRFLVRRLLQDFDELLLLLEVAAAARRDLAQRWPRLLFRAGATQLDVAIVALADDHGLLARIGPRLLSTNRQQLRWIEGSLGELLPMVPDRYFAAAVAATMPASDRQPTSGRPAAWFVSRRRPFSFTESTCATVRVTLACPSPFGHANIAALFEHSEVEMRSAYVVVASLFLFLWGNVALAQHDDAAAKKERDMAQAKAAFKAGQEFVKMDRFADAIVEFRKAYKITGDKLVMGQIAVVFEKAGDYEAALESLKLYREALPKADRGSADEMIKKCKEMIAAGRTKKLVLPTDGKPAKEEGKALVEDKPKEKEPEAAGKSGGKRFWTWIAAGTAGALAVGALVVGLNAQSKYDDLESTCSPDCSDRQSDIDSVETRATVSDVLWGLTAAAVVTAGVLYFLEKPRVAEASKPAPTDRGVDTEEEEDEDIDEEDEEIDAAFSFRRNLRVLPLVGPGGFGIGATLRY